MSKYHLTYDNINKYYKKAITKMLGHTNASNNGNIELKIDTLYNVTNFFDLPKELNPDELDFTKPDNKDYHVILGTLKTPQLKADLWHHRLKNVCTALKSCVESEGSPTTVELGIFGSESYASDVDIGVSYIKGEPTGLQLSEIVKKFEEFFVEQEYTSLDIDVEMYADYFIKDGKPFIQTNKDTYNACLPYLVAGIIKNYLQTFIDVDSTYCDIRRQMKLVLKNNDCGKNIKEVLKVVKDIESLDEMKKQMIKIPKETEDKFKEQTNLLNELTKSIYNNKDDALDFVGEYFNNNYQYACNRYYELLNEAHKEYIKHEINFVDLSQKISHALVFRAESYQCAPTIYHVVYSMQAQAGVEQLNILKNLIQNEGYKISLLEQIGFLIRFEREYEQKNKKDSEMSEYEKTKIEKKRDKKIDKYNTRIQDALDQLSNKGGKKTRKVRLLRKKKRTYKKKRSYKKKGQMRKK